MKPYDFQERDLADLEKNDFTGLLGIEPGGGKAQPLDSKVLTPEGFIRMGDVKVGTEVVVPDGGTAEVIGVYPQGLRPVYRITLIDGRTVLADEDHLWTVESRNSRRYSNPRRVKTTAQIKDTLYRDAAMSSQWFVPVVTPVELSGDWPSNIDPYSLGLLIGDGYFGGNALRYSGQDEELLDHLRGNLTGVKLTHMRGPDYSITGIRGAAPGSNPITVELRRLGLMGKKSAGKFIPNYLMHVSEHDRLSLLQGLFDTDGSPTKNGVEWTSASRQLAEDVQWLSWSMGAKVAWAVKHVPGYEQEYYRLRIVFPSGIAPFRLSRKAGALWVPGKYELKGLAIRSVDYIGEMETQCIKVDHPDQEYVTDGFIRTHNTPLSVFSMQRTGTDVNMIIAPLGTHNSAWNKATTDILGEEVRLIGNSTKAQRTNLLDLELGRPGNYIVTPQLFTRMDISALRPDFLAVDEGHLLNNPGKTGQRKLSGYAMNGSDNPIQAGIRQFLSGTPLRNNFQRAWSIGRFLYPELGGRGQLAYKNYYGWLGERMTSEDVVTGYDRDTKTVKKAKKWLVESVPGQWVSELPCYIMHKRREECCEFHPIGFLTTEEPNVVTRVVPLDLKQKKAIRELEETYMAWLDDNPMVTELTLTQRQRIRTVAAALPAITDEDVVYYPDNAISPFIDETMSILDSVPDEPVIVFCHSQQLAALTTKRLNKNGYKAFEYSGATRKDRDIKLTKFGTEYRVVVIVLAAGGTGLDGLQEISNTEIWIETSVDPVDNTQAEARADRMGAKNQVQRFYIVDDLGYAEGRMSAQLEKRLVLEKSLRKEL